MFHTTNGAIEPNVGTLHTYHDRQRPGPLLNGPTILDGRTRRPGISIPTMARIA